MQRRGRRTGVTFDLRQDEFDQILAAYARSDFDVFVRVQPTVPDRCWVCEAATVDAALASQADARVPGAAARLQRSLAQSAIVVPLWREVPVVAVRNGLEDHAMYNAAKGGVHAVAGSLSREFGKQGVTFNVVAPPAVRSPEFERFLREQPELTQRFVSQIPMGRPAEMSEVAALVEFLAGDEAGFINGQVVGVNGGSTLA